MDQSKTPVIHRYQPTRSLCESPARWHETTPIDTSRYGLHSAHKPKVAGSNPVPAVLRLDQRRSGSIENRSGCGRSRPFVRRGRSTLRFHLRWACPDAAKPDGSVRPWRCHRWGLPGLARGSEEVDDVGCFEDSVALACDVALAQTRSKCARHRASRASNLVAYASASLHDRFSAVANVCSQVPASVEHSGLWCAPTCRCAVRPAM